MASLSFDYDSRSGESVAQYKGLTIRAVQDSDAENPWKAWDCEPPLLVNSGGWRGEIQEYGECTESLGHPWRDMSDSWINRHWRAIREALDISAEADSDMRQSLAYDRKRGWKGASLADLRRDYLDESGLGPFGSDTDKLDAIAAVWNLRGIAADRFSRNGYSQGAWAEILVVMPPSYLEKIGAKRGDSVMLKGAADLFAAWAFGDVYGFVIEDRHGEHLDSCWGYYGSDFDDSGLASAAMNAAESAAQELASASAASAASLKSRIKALAAEIRAVSLPPGICGEMRAAMMRLVGEYRLAMADCRAYGAAAGES